MFSQVIFIFPCAVGENFLESNDRPPVIGDLFPVIGLGEGGGTRNVIPLAFRLALPVHWVRSRRIALSFISGSPSIGGRCPGQAPTVPMAANGKFLTVGGVPPMAASEKFPIAIKIKMHYCSDPPISFVRKNPTNGRQWPPMGPRGPPTVGAWSRRFT